MDWSHELIPSCLWVLRAWSIAAALTLVAMFLLARFTLWGRRVLADHRRLLQRS